MAIPKQGLVVMMITRDEYELPLAVAETMSELSSITGYCTPYISREVKKYMNGKKSRFVIVEVGEDEEGNEDSA